MAYSFYLDGMQLPVTPSKVTMKVKNQNKTMNLINGEEINIVKSPGLTEISFEALLPNMEYGFSYYEGGFQNAGYYLEKLEELKKKNCFPFRIIRTLPKEIPLYNTEKDMNVSLEDYEIKEDADNGFDVMVSIKLRQYRDFATQMTTIKVTEQQDGTVTAEKKVERASEKEPSKSYTVVSGDTLWAICRKEFGDGTKYGEIAKLNNIADPNKIYPGQVIRLS